MVRVGCRRPRSARADCVCSRPTSGSTTARPGRLSAALAVEDALFVEVPVILDVLSLLIVHSGGCASFRDYTVARPPCTVCPRLFHRPWLNSSFQGTRCLSTALSPEIHSLRIEDHPGCLCSSYAVSMVSLSDLSLCRFTTIAASIIVMALVVSVSAAITIVTISIISVNPLRGVRTVVRTSLRLLVNGGPAQ